MVKDKLVTKIYKLQITGLEIRKGLNFSQSNPLLINMNMKRKYAKAEFNNEKNILQYLHQSVMILVYQSK